MQAKTEIIVRRVHDLFAETGATLSTAESCTAGFVAHLITSLPGASAFYEGGVVAYSAAAKIRLLGVPGDIINRQGVVSAGTAGEMAERVRVLLGTDYSVATTGNLGPDVLDGKERGLIYIAVGTRDRTEVRELRLSGEREENKAAVGTAVLQFLVEMIEREKR
ncbi:MAG TPA: CinA family protein [Dissulfurispiraceae bacterium]|nr:CinA family protein [Dissulfurispiraceae bacterium]